MGCQNPGGNSVGAQEDYGGISLINFNFQYFSTFFSFSYHFIVDIMSGTLNQGDTQYVNRQKKKWNLQKNTENRDNHIKHVLDNSTWPRTDWLTFLQKTN